MSPIEISAEILKKIKLDCEQYFADKNPNAVIRKAVITCPAYFSANEVENTMKAGQLAGFDVQEIVREPIAAAIYYGVENLIDGSRLLVCDLGGGTFDASILMLEDGVFHHLATTGDRQLGGHDWTTDMRDLVADRFTNIFHENPRSDQGIEQYLYDSCEQLKRDFARLDQGTIHCTYKGQSAEVSVTRAEFERLTEWRVREVLDWAEKALAKCNPQLTWNEIDCILLVGGSTRLRRIPEAFEQLSGKKPVQTAEADTMVVLGAAILARGAYRPRRAASNSGFKQSPVSGLTMIDFQRTTVRNIGTRVIAHSEKGWEVRNSIIIPYGESLPTQRTGNDYRISTAEQPFFDIPVIEFDDVGADSIQQTYRFVCPPALPEGTPVQITFRYDKNGQIDVDAVELHSNSSLPKLRVNYQEPDLQDLVSPDTPQNKVSSVPTVQGIEPSTSILYLLTLNPAQEHGGITWLEEVGREMVASNVPLEQVSFTAFLYRTKPQRECRE
jgi:molecular chaperone DnaK